MSETLTAHRLTTAVCERPFIAKPHEVRAMLENRMTQFRRPMKPQPQSVDTLAHTVIPYTGSAEFLMEHIRCPFGSPGDILWVKETWYCPKQLGGTYHREKLVYRSDFADRPPAIKAWSSPVSMPREFSRLKLEIVDVKAERVCEVSEDDAIDNGFLPHGNLGAMSARDWLIVHWDLDFPAHPWESSWVWVVTFRRTA